MEDKKICIKCKERDVKEGQSYCQKCYSLYQREYRERHKGYYLYLIIGEEDKILYVGATEKIFQRISAHITLNSHISDYMKLNEWEVIKYIDITNLVEDRNELLILENVLLGLYEPPYNKKGNLNKVKDIDKLRELSLLAELHSFNINNKWNIYAKNEYKKNAFKCWEH